MEAAEIAEKLAGKIIDESIVIDIMCAMTPWWVDDLRRDHNNGTNWWITRDRLRIGSGVYVGLNHQYCEDPYGVMMLAFSEKVHMALMKTAAHATSVPGNVRFTPDAKHGKTDNHITMKFGRFLSRYTDMSEKDIKTATESWMAETNRYTLHFAKGEEEILRVYWDCLTGSCMSKEHDYYTDITTESGEIWHPVRAYDTPDVGVAYLKDAREDGCIVSRCLVNKLTNEWVRIYGIEGAMRYALESKGYKHGSLRGCRLKVQFNKQGKLILPYVDGFYQFGEYDGTDVRVDEEGNLGELTHYDHPYYRLAMKCKTCSRSLNSEGVPDVYTIANWESEGFALCGNCAFDNHTPHPDIGYAHWNSGLDSVLVDITMFEDADNYQRIERGEGSFPMYHTKAEIEVKLSEGSLQYDFDDDLCQYPTRAMMIDPATGNVTEVKLAGWKCTSVNNGRTESNGNSHQDYHTGQLEDGLFDGTVVQLTAFSPGTWWLRENLVKAYHRKSRTTLAPRRMCVFNKHDKEFYTRHFARRNTHGVSIDLYGNETAQIVPFLRGFEAKTGEMDNVVWFRGVLTTLTEDFRLPGRTKRSIKKKPYRPWTDPADLLAPTATGMSTTEITLDVIERLREGLHTGEIDFARQIQRELQGHPDEPEN